MINIIIFIILCWHVLEATLNANHVIREQSLECIFLDDQLLPEIIELFAEHWLFFVSVVNIVEPVKCCHWAQIL